MIAESVARLRSGDRYRLDGGAAKSADEPFAETGWIDGVGFDSLIVTVNLTSLAIDKSYAVTELVNSPIAASAYVHFEESNARLTLRVLQ